MEEIEEGGGILSTLDTAFWSAVISSVASRHRVEVRSVGNKPTVEAIARLVAQGSVNRVIVALDRDFDDRRGRKLQHGNIMYTFGYSWENDVFSAETMIEVISSLVPDPDSFAEARGHIEAASRQLTKCFAKLVRFDHALASAGSELTVRDELLRCIQQHEAKPPVINRSVLAAEIKRCRTSSPARRMGSASSALPQRDLHGHTIAKWWLAQIHHVLRTYIGLKLSRQVLERLSISTYLRNTQADSWKYYRDQINNLVFDSQPK